MIHILFLLVALEIDTRLSASCRTIRDAYGPMNLPIAKTNVSVCDGTSLRSLHFIIEQLRDLGRNQLSFLIWDWFDGFHCYPGSTRFTISTIKKDEYRGICIGPSWAFEGGVMIHLSIAWCPFGESVEIRALPHGSVRKILWTAKITNIQILPQIVEYDDPEPDDVSSQVNQPIAILTDSKLRGYYHRDQYRGLRYHNLSGIPAPPPSPNGMMPRNGRELGVRIKYIQRQRLSVDVKFMFDSWLTQQKRFETRCVLLCFMFGELLMTARETKWIPLSFIIRSGHNNIGYQKSRILKVKGNVNGDVILTLSSSWREYSNDFYGVTLCSRIPKRPNTYVKADELIPGYQEVPLV